MPDASPRSVTNSRVSLHVIQSWGRQTRETRAQASGSERCSHDNFVMVNAATGTDPHALAQPASAPARWSISHRASGADSVSFQSLAGRTT